MTPDGTLRVLACDHCHGRYLPRPGACPRCGSRDVGEGSIPAHAVVLAATELLAPAAGWTAPHRLVLAEAAHQVRLLAIAPGGLPAVGATVEVRERDGRYEVVLGRAADPLGR